MACHTPPLKKLKKQGEMTLPSLGPIPSLHFSSKSFTTVQTIWICWILLLW